MKNELVVGVTGTIGSALFHRLRSMGSSVFGTSHREVPDGSSIFHLNLLDDPASWQFSDMKFDVAYLCAGVCRMNLCEEDPEGTQRANVDGMIALAKRLSEAGTFIVYLSTNQVFSGESPHVKEEASYQPLNEYGRQKSVVETFLKTHCPQSAIVRLTKVVEPNMSLIKNWIDQLNRHETVTAFKDMVLAPVSLRQVLDVLIQIGKKKQSGLFQVSGAEDISYFELATYLAKRLQKPTTLVEPVSALDKGIKKSFLPLFTTLVCSSTIALCGEMPPRFDEVLQECFGVS